MAVGGVSTIFLGFGSQIVTTNFVSGIDLVRQRHCFPRDVSARESQSVVVPIGVP